VGARDAGPSARTTAVGRHEPRTAAGRTDTPGTTHTTTCATCTGGPTVAAIAARTTAPAGDALATTQPGKARR
jgi:hypothetical protein